MVDADEKEVVILVVANEKQDKVGVVDCLRRDGTWEQRQTAAGVLILTSLSPARVIVDTTPLRNVEGRSPTAIARRWVSENSLRRILFGKLVVVVCVITCSVKERCKWDMFSYSNCWVDVFGLIVKNHKAAVLMLVNTEGNNVGEATKIEVDRFVRDHGFTSKSITYSNLQGGDDSVRVAIERSVSLSKSCKHTILGALFTKQSSNGEPLPRVGVISLLRAEATTRSSKSAQSIVTPSLVENVFAVKERFGPWGPERVMLFGRTGSGKSTVAQMLTTATLDPDSIQFKSSSGMRGGTGEVQHGEGRGWYVVDTPGFGEPNVEQSTISTHQAERSIKRYVKLVEGTFSHYLFVAKKDRTDELDYRLWKFFVALFGEDIQDHFSVVVTNADEEWLAENKIHLRRSYKGCNSFLCAEFSPLAPKGDDELENELQSVRASSLQELEDQLAKLRRVDLQCRYGKDSKMQYLNERDRANIDLGIEKDVRIKFLATGANVCFSFFNACSKVVSPITELTSLLKVDDKITLLPG